MILRLAVAMVELLAAIAPAPVRADVCTDFHAALAIEQAAREVADSYELKHPVPLFDSESVNRLHREVQKSLNRARNEASEVLQRAERGIRDSIEDERIARMIDSIVAVRNAARDAIGTAGEATMRREFQSLGTVRPGLFMIGHSARESHHDALTEACRLGLASKD